MQDPDSVHPMGERPNPEDSGPPGIFFAEALRALGQEALLRNRTHREGPCSRHILLDGKRYLNFSSNDYLGLASHPALRRASRSAIPIWGTGSGGSRLLGGGMALHAELEKKISAFRGTEDALLFNCGFMANTGLLQALAPAFSLVLSDRLNHASVMDGLKASPIPFRRYRHGDLNHLESLLHQSGAPDTVLVVSETVFSMDGDRVDLPALMRLQRRLGFHLLLDEAHSVGCEDNMPEALNQGIKPRQIIMGTFGKALGSFGAYVAGTSPLIEFLVNKSRSFIFTTAVPPAVLAASSEGLAIAQRESWRRHKLEALSEYTRRLFLQRGLPFGKSSSQIIPILVGSNRRALEAASCLRERGLYVVAIRHPTVPQGTARIRCNITAAMEESDLELLADTAADILERLPEGTGDTYSERASEDHGPH